MLFLSFFKSIYNIFFNYIHTSKLDKITTFNEDLTGHIATFLDPYSYFQLIRVKKEFNQLKVYYLSSLIIDENKLLPNQLKDLMLNIYKLVNLQSLTIKNSDHLWIYKIYLLYNCENLYLENCVFHSLFQYENNLYKNLKQISIKNGIDNPKLNKNLFPRIKGEIEFYQ